MVGGATLATAGLLFAAARSGPCEVASHRALSVDELIAVRQRFEAYRSTPELGFSLSEEELGMLLEDPEDVPVFLALEGEQVHGQVALPAAVGRCWPVAFSGSLQIDGQKAHFDPARVTLGALDVGWLLGSGAMELLPEQMPTRRTRTFLEATRRGEVVAGRLDVVLVAPETFRFQ